MPKLDYLVHTQLVTAPAHTYSVMAGIIGQLTAAARKRKDAKIINSDKCMYTIPEFDPNGFDPLVHNSYVSNRARMEEEMELNQTDYGDVCKLEAVCGLLSENY